jgi:RNA polymerase sigma-70 factor (ECF subfamily)
VVKEAVLTRFEKNVEAAIPALRRYARALTRDSEVADDLVENTLLRAFSSKHLFNGSVVRGRLYSILIALNGDRLRASAPRPTLVPCEGKDAPDVTGADAGGQGIERALSALVEDQRNALLLVVLEGLTYGEVAEVQGVPIGTVTSRLARARDAIKNAVEDGGNAMEAMKFLKE